MILFFVLVLFKKKNSYLNSKILFKVLEKILLYDESKLGAESQVSLQCESECSIGVI